MDIYVVSDKGKYLGHVQAIDRKQAKHKFFEENPDIDAERIRQGRVKCSYSVKKTKS